MIFFWLVCALFVVIALAFVLPPLLEANADATIEAARKEANIAVYRDQIEELEADRRNGIVSAEQYQQDREELERRLLEDVSGPGSKTPPKPTKKAAGGRGLVYAIALGLPLIAVAFYLQVGNRAAITGTAAATQPTQPSTPPADNQQMSRERIEANVAALAKRLEQNPNDAEGWVMLASSYTSMERYSDAATAYARATALKPTDADLLVDYAFAIAMTNNRKLEGKPTELLTKALKMDPENAKALQLGGGAAYEAKNYAQAIQYWEKLLQKTPEGSDLRQLLEQRIADAKAASAKN